MLLGCAPSPLDCHDSPHREGGHSNVHDVVGEFLVIRRWWPDDGHESESRDRRCLFAMGFYEWRLVSPDQGCCFRKTPRERGTFVGIQEVLI